MAATKKTLEVLIDLLFAGTPQGVIKTVLKTAVGQIKPEQKNWEQLYIDAFNAAAEAMNPQLAKYAAPDGEVGLDADRLRVALQGELSIHELAESDLRSDAFLDGLAERLLALDALTIGGNRLSEADTRQLLRNLVRQHAPAQFKKVVEQDENAFRQALRREAHGTNARLEDVQAYLRDHHELILDGLADIREDIAGIPERVADELEARAAAAAPQKPPEPDSVFLSYAWDDDKPFVEKLYADLTAAGLTVWWDDENLPSRGSTLRKELKEGIERAARFVPVIGPVAAEKAATPGTNINLEWDTARQLCKAVTAILRLGNESLIPPDFAGPLWFDFRDDAEYDAMLAKLITRLREPAALPGPLRGGPWRIPPVGALPRSELVIQVKAALRPDDPLPVEISGQVGVTGIHAPGGLGKSILATLVAYDCGVRRGFPDGVVWITVGQGTGADELRIRIGAAFGLSAEQMQQPGALTALLHDKDCLIIFDDAWERAPLEASIVPGADVRYLITSRTGSLLDLPEENRVKLGYLSDAEGAELIARRLGIPTLPPDEGGEASWPDRPDHLAIARALGGHLQAIAICAARLANKDPELPADLLADLRGGDPALLEALKREIDDESREGNFLKSFALSYEALPEDMQRRFRLLGVFAAGGSFAPEAAAAVWQEESAGRALRSLASRALLEEAGQGRYALHALSHAAARALLEMAGKREEAFDRYAEYVTALAEAFDELPPEEWQALEPDLPHVDHMGDALAARYAQGPGRYREQAGRFAWNTTRYVARRPQVVRTEAGTTLRGLSWLEMGLAAARADGNQKREALFLNNIGLAWDALGEKRKALDFYEQALPVFRAVGDRGGEATTLNNIGAAWDALGEKRKALEFYEQALELTRAVGDRGGEAATLNNIGAAWDDLGEKRKALDFCEQALPLRRAVGDRGGEATTLNNIGAAWDALGEKRKALAFYEQALPVFRAVGDRGGEATTCYNMGVVYRSLGDLERAIEYVERCVELEEQILHPDLEDDRRTLERLKAERDGIGAPPGRALSDE